MSTGLKPMRTAFVMNGDSNGLGICRSLGRKGVPVVALDHRHRAPALSSRFARPMVCPDPSSHPEELAERMAEAAQGLGEKGVLFACSDEFALFVSRQRRRLEQHFDFMIPSERIVEGMVNKRYQYEEAVRQGIPVPEMRFPISMDEVREVSKQVAYPAFIKPYYSHLWNSRFGNKGFIVKSPMEMEERFSAILGTGLECMVQSIVGVPGRDLVQACAYRSADGYMSPVFTWEKTRQVPPNFGVGSLCTSRHIPEVAALGRRFLEGLDYRGIGAVEFKLDPDDGVWRLMELNTRPWLQNHHSTCAGLNLAYLEYLDICGRPREVADDFREGVVFWDAMGDLESFWTLHRRGRLGAGEWVRSCLGADCYSAMALDDVRPALVKSAYGVGVAKLMVYLLRRKTDPDDLGPVERA